MHNLIQDLRYAFRGLRKKPGFALLTVLTLGLGIGVNTALFSCFNIFLRPKPVRDPNSIVIVEHEGDNQSAFSFSDYQYLRKHSQVFSDVIAGQTHEKLLLGERATGTEPEEVMGSFVSENFFAMLGGGTGLGRFFTPEENQVAGRDAVVVLSHKFWQRRFASDPQIVGRNLYLNGRPFTVIGVTHPSFVGLRYEMPDIWLPLMMRAATPTVHFENVPPAERDWFGGQRFRWLNLHARLKPDTTVEEAQAEMQLLQRQLTPATTEAEAREIIAVKPFGVIGGENEVWGVMALVLGASGLVLLIACFNIANMQLARATARQKEIGVRLCLGANRWRLVRQLLTESLLLAVIGGCLGVLFAWWSLDLLLTSLTTRYGGGDVARLALDISPDWRVLVFSFLLALVSGVAFGLVPALRATRPNLVAMVKDEASGGSGRAARSWLSSSLVVAQIAICLVLLIPAGLLLRGLQRVLTTDPGFETKKLLSVGYSLELSGYDEQRAQLFQQQLVDRIAGLPGVVSVSLDRNSGGRAIVTLLDQPQTGENQFGGALFEGITDNYLHTIGTPLLQGRSFTAEEAKANAPVVIVSESTARSLWPGQNPIGRLLRLEATSRRGNEVIFASAQVVGVARDNQRYRIGQTAPLFIYVAEKLIGEMDTTLLVRTTGDSANLKQQIRKTAYDLEPVLRLNLATAEESIAADENVLLTRAASEGATVLGGLALLLAMIGIYGTLAWSVARRTREMGIRMALGAQRGEVMALVLRQGMRLVLVGVAIGVPASLAVMQLMKSMLFGLSTADPIALTTVTASLAIVALVACYIPARRATKVDPLVALRYE